MSRHIILCLAVSGLWAPTVHGTDYTWTGASGTAFEWPTNWTPFGGPPSDSSDRAIFDLAGSHTVGFGDDAAFSKSLEVRAGSWDFNMWDASGQGYLTYRLWPTNTSQPAVTIGTTEGVTEVIARSQNVGGFDAQGTLTLGLFAGNIGRLELLRTDWGSPSSAVIGHGGAGVLVLEGNGTNMQNSSATLGNLAGSLGLANVNASAFWELSSTLFIGNRGTGGLHINESGRVRNAGDASLGVLAGSSGTVILHHPDARWENTAHLFVGGNAAAAGGNGQLTIDAGTVDVAGNLTVWSDGEVAINAAPSSGETGVGTLDVDGVLTVNSGGGLYLAGGTLHVASAANFRPAPGAVHWSAGELDIDSGGLVIGSMSNPQAPLGPTVAIESGKKLSVPFELAVGSSGGAQLDIGGGEVTSGSAVIGGTNSSIVSVTGSSARWNAGSMTIGGQRTPQMTQLVASAGAQLTSSTVEVAEVPATPLAPELTAAVRLEGAGTYWQTIDRAQLGWSSTGQYDRGGVGSLAINAGATFDTDGALLIGRNFTVTLDGGTIITGWSAGATVLGSVASSGGGSNTWVFDHPVVPPSLLPPPNILSIDDGSVNLGNSGLLETHGLPVTIEIKAGGTLTSKIHGDGNTQVMLADGGSKWTTPGPLSIDGAAFGIGELGSLTLGSGATVNVGGPVTVTGADRFTLNGGTLNATTFSTQIPDFAGFGAINARFSSPGNVTATGNLTLGDHASYTGVQIGGELSVGTHTVTINKLGFFNIGTFTQIAGGTLVAPSGVSLPSGHALAASGAILGPVAAQVGSTISAAGNLTLGDFGAVDGFFSDGVLLVGSSRVTLRDANEAVLGSRTFLGSGVGPGSAPGTLISANGAVVEFGKNLIGYGTLVSPNDPLRPIINNGFISGNSPLEPITLSGYVKGVGRFNHVVFAGTFSPGLSPAAVQLGDAAYADGSMVLVELGGTIPGTQYDQLLHSGAATLGGTLDVDLLGGFSPVLGQQFVLATYATHVGEFDALALPLLASGLGWSLAYEPTSLILSVTTSTANLPGDIDLDGDVDRTDVSLFAQNYGRTTGSVWTTGDFNADGATNLLDLSLQQANIGRSAPSPSPSSAAVPEPATWGMALLFVTATLAARRRQLRR